MIADDEEPAPARHGRGRPPTFSAQVGAFDTVKPPPRQRLLSVRHADLEERRRGSHPAPRGQGQTTEIAEGVAHSNRP